MSISLHEFVNGYGEFQRRERRDAMYKTAIFLVNHFWGKPADMADGMGVLLLTWNQAFYRYGPFDFDKLERTIESNFTAIEGFHDRDILTLSTSDEPVIKELFEELLEALQIADGKMKGRKSPVAVSKALHLLGPAFFTLWDDKIARAYDSYYNPHPCDKYLSFSYKMQNLAQQIGSQASSGGKTLLKLIDEYNYAKHTKGWI
ncbi:MAG: hypothetical protein HY787_10185 [Deltaproteobacteria bacterium]|nr:hypothetical protein [Deltaproteobacteria bacterium]